jgi:hypothetical protein
MTDAKLELNTTKSKIELTPEQLKEIADAHRLVETTHHMLKECDDPSIIPTLKKIYFDTIERKNKIHKRLGV